MRTMHWPPSAAAAPTPSQRLAEQTFELVHEGEAFDREWYLREVLPGLSALNTKAIAKGTGMSTTAASKFQSGKRVPHPRHWEELSSLATH